MNNRINNYELFFKFIDQYVPDHLKENDENDPFIGKLEEMTKANNQFFFLFDILQLRILYSSKGSLEMLGVDPKEINPSVFIKLMHPDDYMWYTVYLEKLLNLGMNIYHEKKGNTLVSTNYRLKSPGGGYISVLDQSYLFFNDVSYKTAFILHVLTNISWFRKEDPGYHFYLGNDPYFFRYPDEKLLRKGNASSNLNIYNI